MQRDKFSRFKENNNPFSCCRRISPGAEWGRRGSLHLATNKRPCNLWFGLLRTIHYFIIFCKFVTTGSLRPMRSTLFFGRTPDSAPLVISEINLTNGQLSWIITVDCRSMSSTNRLLNVDYEVYERQHRRHGRHTDHFKWHFDLAYNSKSTIYTVTSLVKVLTFESTENFDHFLVKTCQRLRQLIQRIICDYVHFPIQRKWQSKPTARHSQFNVWQRVPR